MRYKARFQPSQLACPETFEWISTNITNPLLDEAKYVRFSSAEKKDADAVDFTPTDLQSPR